MTDNLTTIRRSWNMSRIHSKNTDAEMRVRRLIHRMGFRYRLHRRDLPGKPDIVLPRFKAIIFVNGCFWHRHPECKIATTPKTNTKFWQDKFDYNSSRDTKNYNLLSEMGWRILIIWQCELKDTEVVEQRIRKYLANEQVNTD